MNVRLIAARIASELRAEPWRWIQGKYWTEDGAACLAGHICHHVGLETSSFESYLIAYEAFARHIWSSSVGCNKEVAISVWNDANCRTVEDVIALCEEVARADDLQIAA